MLRDGTKPLPEPMLTYRQWGSVTITWQFHKRYLSHKSLKLAWKSLIKISFKSPKDQELNIIYKMSANVIAHICLKIALSDS